NGFETSLKRPKANHGPAHSLYAQAREAVFILPHAALCIFMKYHFFILKNKHGFVIIGLQTKLRGRG
ncbi:hypothetical protein MR857_00345, partial [bacterium]|nr:hypothetical protein [bacterium]